MPANGSRTMRMSGVTPFPKSSGVGAKLAVQTRWQKDNGEIVSRSEVRVL
jgi:hypothetical protein